MTTASLRFPSPSARPRRRRAASAARRSLWARPLALLRPLRHVDPVRAGQALQLRCLDPSAW